MLRYIFGKVGYQVFIMVLFFFFGEKFLIEEFENKQKRNSTNFVKSGLRSKGYNFSELGISRHSTYNFNVFVVMTLFSYIDARKLNNELNPFKRICRSKVFLVVFFVVLLLQYLLVSFGGIVFKVRSGVI